MSLVTIRDDSIYMNPSIFTSIINSYLPEPQASLLNGIIFGIDLKSTRTFYQAIKEVGLLHIVVLSGINITILTAIIGNVTIKLGRKVSTIVSILSILIFIVFVGPKPPIVRAGVTGIIALVAIIYGRKKIALYSLLISAIFIAIFWPSWITTISFQLSYTATLGIILFGHPKYHKKVENLYQYLQKKAWEELKPCLAAYFFTLPIIFINFRQLSLIAPLSNLLISFIIAPLMIFGFLTAVLGKINFILGIIPALVCYGILSYLVFVIETLAKIPFGFIQF